MPTSIKDALIKWEEKNEQKAQDAKEVRLNGTFPPIEKMDISLSVLTNCERLTLSTNLIEKITNLNALKNLKVLSLGRNMIKTLNGIEAVADTLEELWISYNYIDKLKGINALRKLRVLYISNNLINNWEDFNKLAECPNLVELLFIGNPLYERELKNNYRDTVVRIIKSLKKLDDTPVILED